MNMLTKVFVVTNAVFALLFLAVVFTQWSKETNWVQATIDVIGRHNKVYKEYSDYKLKQEAEMANLRLQQQEAEDRRLRAQTENETLTARLAAVSGERDNLQTQLDTASRTAQANVNLAAEMKTLVDNYKTENATQGEALKVAQATAAAATESLIELGTALVSKDDQIKTLMGQVAKLHGQIAQLNENRDAPGGGVLSPIPARAIETTIAQTDGVVVVLGAGQAAGVRKDMQFMVTNDDEGWIGRVQVRTVGENHSVADIMKITPEPSKITAGDVARTDRGI